MSEKRGSEYRMHWKGFSMVSLAPSCLKSPKPSLIHFETAGESLLFSFSLQKEHSRNKPRVINYAPLLCGCLLARREIFLPKPFVSSFDPSVGSALFSFPSAWRWRESWHRPSSGLLQVTVRSSISLLPSPFPTGTLLEFEKILLNIFQRALQRIHYFDGCWD